MYTDKVMEHFTHPRNVGKFENPDGEGEVGNPQCGDVMKIGIMVQDDAIADIRFQTLGCAAAIATSSMITEMAKGKKLADAEKLTRKDVADALDGLPAAKMHCSNLAADALREAIKNYRTKHSEKGG